MNRIDPGKKTSQRTSCTFCSYSCDLEITSGDLGIIGVDYPSDGLYNQGRLCPRGSAAAQYLDHPLRLTSPRGDDSPRSWNDVQALLKKAVKRPERTAITFDRNLTLEEYEMLAAAAAGLGITNFASSYLEPEAVLHPFYNPEQPFNFAELDSTQAVLIVGDLFNQFPMTSRPLIEWRYRDRKNRLIVIDSVGTYTGKFATDWIRTPVGYEPLMLLALAGRSDPADDLGAPVTKVRELAAMLASSKGGMGFACLPFGRTRDPLLFGAALSCLREAVGIRVVPFAEYAGPQGRVRFGDILAGVKNRSIKHVINFGEIFPAAYPTLRKPLGNVEIISCVPWLGDGFLAIPTAAQLEKAGTVMTSFGMRHIEPAMAMASGSRTIAEIIALLKAPAAANPGSVSVPSIDIGSRVARLREPVRSRRKMTFTLIGEKAAFDFMALWREERLRINPVDARKLSILPDDRLTVTSAAGEAEFPVELSPQMPIGVVSLPVETPRTRGLFEHEIDEGFVHFIPTGVALCRKE